jgi:hypothetical protein
MARLGLKKVVDWILVQICKVNLKMSLLITPCNLLFHLSILRVFIPMQVLFVPNLLLFFYKFFLFFFCKEGLKEIQPPSQCFRPLWTWLGLNFQGFVCIVHFFVWFVLCCKIVHFYAGGFKKPQPLHCVFDYLQISRVEKASTVSQWFRLLANRVQKALTPFFSQCFCLSLCFWLVCLLCLQSCNTSIIPRTQPLPCHCVLYLILICSQGHITILIVGQNRH